MATPRSAMVVPAGLSGAFDTGGVLKREKKSVPERQFCKRTACSSYVQPLLVAIGGWWLVVGDWRLMAVGGGWWRVVVGDWWLVAVGSGWRLAVGRRWRLAVGGSWWRLAVGGGWWLVVGGPFGAALKGGP